MTDIRIVFPKSLKKTGEKVTPTHIFIGDVEVTPIKSFSLNVGIAYSDTTDRSVRGLSTLTVEIPIIGGLIIEYEN